MRKQSGFSLIELMVTVAIIGIITAIALPNYRNYVIKSRLTDAFSGLAAAQASAEQFWSNNRTYTGFNVANGLPKDTANFTFALSNDSASTYTLTATGVGGTPVAGAVYTINQDGTKATTSGPSEWGGSSTTCWINSAGGACVQ